MPLQRWKDLIFNESMCSDDGLLVIDGLTNMVWVHNYVVGVTTGRSSVLGIILGDEVNAQPTGTRLALVVRCYFTLHTRELLDG